MPCRTDYEDDYSSHINGVKVGAARVRKELSPLLCNACSILEKHDLLPKELIHWWDLHKEEDRLRKQDAKNRRDAAGAAQKRREYLASVRERLKTQLTDDEKEALNFRD